MKAPTINELKALVPPLLQTNYKGLCGKVAVVGGCREYTGAPYFAAMTALRVGADLSHVFCTEGAATVIKAYSPELIVHPYLPDSDSTRSRQEAVDLISQWIPRFNSIVIGPGLGRDPVTLDTVRFVFQEARKQGIPLVVDADGLWLVNQEPGLVLGNSRAILTPNPVEYQRLAKALGVGSASEIARKLGGPFLVQKGDPDLITNGTVELQCGEEGSHRRCGGQGDVLSGTIAVYAAWAHLAATGKFPSVQGACSEGEFAERVARGCFASATLVRKASRTAFERKGRAMLATDMIEDIGAVFSRMYDS